jgi:3-oxoacyl-[acyl-carrier protein] reductase
VVGLDLGEAEVVHPRYRHLVIDAGDGVALAAALAALELECVAHLATLTWGSGPGDFVAARCGQLVSAEEFGASVQTNLTTHYATLLAVLAYMEHGEGDRSVTLCSSINAIADYGEAPYAAAKAGLIGLVKALTGWMGKRGIRINAILPGTVWTPGSEAAWGEGAAEHFAAGEDGTALGRLGEPDDIAEGFWSVSQLKALTGQTLVIDGGQSTLHRSVAR